MRTKIPCLAAVLILLFLAACSKPVPAEPEAAAEKPTAVEIVTYYCDHPTEVLLDQISVWNETVGAVQNIELQVSSPCNCGRSLADHLQQGDRWDLIDGGSDSALQEQGWLKHLEELSNPQIKALSDSYRAYRSPQETAITSLPTEACPIKLAVNLELFEKHGLALPTTWEETAEAARIITVNGSGTEFGWGFCNWQNYFHHFILLGAAQSVHAGHWDRDRAQYSFSQYGPVIQALAQMQADGAAVGLDTMTLDEVRAQFAAGEIAMLPALGYDFTVYTRQFPVRFDYTFLDLPGNCSGVYLTDSGPSICAPSYDAATDAHRQAVEEAWLFLNSDALLRTLYQHGCIIPTKQSIPADAPLLFSEHADPWLALSDLTCYVPASADPDALLHLDTPSYDEVFSCVIRGDQPWTAALAADLETCYQAAYADLIQSSK